MLREIATINGGVVTIIAPFILINGMNIEWTGVLVGLGLAASTLSFRRKNILPTA